MFEVDRRLLEPGYLWLLAVAGLPGLVCWLAGNLALETIGGVPRFRSTPALQCEAAGADAAGKAVSPVLPPFFRCLRGLNDLRPDELIALEAADLDEAGRSLRAILVTGDRLPVSLPNRNRACASFCGTQAGSRSRI